VHTRCSAHRGLPPGREYHWRGETTARLDCAWFVFTAQESGVAVRPAVFYFRHRVDDNPAQLAKMRQVAGQVPGFVRDPR
jgi:hypothetical protein